jgi:hypothetical protein
MTAAPETPAGRGHPAPGRDRVSLRALWFGLAGAPAAWSLQLTIQYALAAHDCYPHRTPSARPLGHALGPVIGIATVLAVAIAVGAFGTALYAWRVTRDEVTPWSHAALLEVGEGRTRFMAYAGMLASLLFLFGIGLNAIASVLAGAC